MKHLVKKFRHNISLAAVCLLAFALVMLGAPISTSILIVCLWQLSQFALSKRCLAGSLYISSFTPEQIEEWNEIMRGLGKYNDIFPIIRENYKNWNGTVEQVRQLEAHLTQMDQTLKSAQRSFLSRTRAGDVRPRGGVSDECARSLAAAVVLHVAKCGKLDAMIVDSRVREAVFSEARAFAGISKDMTTSEIPLPAQYGTELLELIAEFGVARRYMFPYPMSGGENKPPRWGTRPAFGSIAMSALVTEKKPTLEFCTLTSKKLGGAVIMPREIDDQSLVPMGRFLARYGAVEFARAEDTWAFMADGSNTYEGVEGISKIASAAGKKVILGAGKTKPTDATLADFRALRRQVSTAALQGGAYYLNQTWESQLRNYNTRDEVVFMYRPDGTATLDGFPIRWLEIAQPANDVAAPDALLAAFGRLEFWFFGMRGTPRIDTSEHVLFMYDQIATRFLEEIDFDYAAIDAMAVLKTNPGT